MSTWIEAAPAYGRDYKNQKEVKADWKEGKDFIDTSTNRYVNNADAERYDIKVIVRYAKFTKTVQVN